MLSENIVKDGEAHYYIEGEGNRCFYGKVPRELPERNPSTIIDGIFWNDFRSRLNPYISQINQGYTVLLFFFLFGLIFWSVLSPILFKELYYTDSTLPVNGIYVWVLIFFVSNYLIVKRNVRIDNEIKNILENEMNCRLRSKGQSIEYRTKWTGFCKPKRKLALSVINVHLTESHTYVVAFTFYSIDAVPKRVFVFTKLEGTIPDSENTEKTNQFSFTAEKNPEKDQPSNNDLDVENWGLKYEETNNRDIDRDAWGLNY